MEWNLTAQKRMMSRLSMHVLYGKQMHYDCDSLRRLYRASIEHLPIESRQWRSIGRQQVKAFQHDNVLLDTRDTARHRHLSIHRAVKRSEEPEP